jgi:photosystem II stability/assembly factor-like uncharacterized protein
VTRRGITRAAVTAATLFASTIASANGRFPRAARLIESPSDSNRIAIVATYGLLLTDDRGGHWYHVCDAAFTFEQGFSTDPIFTLTAGESFLVGAQTRLTRSSDRGCSWTKVLEPANASIDDFAAIPGDADDIVAVVTDYGAAMPEPRLQESVDGGVTWMPIGSPLPVRVAYTLDVDPKNRAHLYATGSGADAASPSTFLSSSDRGTTWTSHPIPNTSASAAPYIAAIHPADGNKIFVRTDGWKMTSNGEAADDALLYSADGGVTWTELLHAAGADAETAGAKLLGFALSPDGSTVLAGYGDPVDPLRTVDPDSKWRGTYRSSSDGHYSFGPGAPSAPTPSMPANVSCLTWTTTGIYTCILQQDKPSLVTFTADPTLAKAPTIMMETNGVLGQPPCCGGKLAATCTWGTDCRALGACDAGAGGPPLSCVDSGAPGGGRSSDAAVDVGSSTGAGGATGASAASSGCGCRTSAKANTGSLLTVLLTALALIKTRGRSKTGRRTRL